MMTMIYLDMIQTAALVGLTVALVMLARAVRRIEDRLDRHDKAG